MVFDLKPRGLISTRAARDVGLSVSRRFSQLGAIVSDGDLDNTPIKRDAYNRRGRH